MRILPPKRHRSRRKERTIACQCCDYPVSQRHHLLPVARYGDNNATVNLCANCHEGYHIMEQGFLDFAAGRYKSHALHLMGAIRWAWGGSESPRVIYICDLLDRAHEMQRKQVQDFLTTEERAIRRRLRKLLDEHDAKDGTPMHGVDVRRGDTVRLVSGKIVQVVSVTGGTVHTTDGIYALSDIEKIAQWG